MSTFKEVRESPLSAVSKLLFGRATRLQTSLVTVNTVITRLAASNPGRLFLLVQNRSSNFGAAGWDNTLIVANGLLVGANGGALEITARDDGEVVGYELFGINDTAAGSWRVVEIIAL